MKPVSSVVQPDIRYNYTSTRAPATILFSPGGEYLVVFKPRSGLFVWAVPWYLEKIQAATESEVLSVPGNIVSGQAINVRNGPSQYASVVGQLEPNASVMIVGKTEDESWLQILFKFDRAWVAAFLVEMQGNLDSVPVADPDTDIRSQQTWQGTVKDITNEQPVGDVYVVTRDFDEVTWGGRDGVFVFDGITAGEQTVWTFSLYHHVPYEDGATYWLDPMRDQTVSDVYVLPNEIVQYKARLFAEDSSFPIATRPVTVRRLDTMEVVGSFTTDAIGYTPMLELPSGPYLFIAQEEGYELSAVKTIESSEDDTEQELRLILEPLTLLSVQAIADEMVTVVATPNFGQCRDMQIVSLGVFDRETGQLLVHEYGPTQRVLGVFDPRDTSGRYIIRLDAICGSQKHIVAVEFTELDPAVGGQIVIAREY